jgi:hypothetical protein
MDWIERMFHLHPDGGGGSFELLVEGAAALVVSQVIVRRAMKKLRLKGHPAAAPSGTATWSSPRR